MLRFLAKIDRLTSEAAKWEKPKFQASWGNWCLRVAFWETGACHSAVPIQLPHRGAPDGENDIIFPLPKNKFGSIFFMFKLLEYIASRRKPKTALWFSHLRPGQELPQTGLFL